MTLNGIDISNWQRGIDLAAVHADFVIVKLTEGTWYVSDTYPVQLGQALALGRKTGAYHYASGTNPTSEADVFCTHFAPYKGKAIPILDWESGGNAAWGDGNWVRTWTDRVHSRTGIWPMVYVQSSAINQIPLDVRANCGLWVAQYASMNPVYGYQTPPWNEGAYSCAMRQYTGTGRLNGWNGDLDLNKFYGNQADWDAYATGGRKDIDMSATADILKRYMTPVFLAGKDSGERLLWIPTQGVYGLHEPAELHEVATDYKNIHGITIPTVTFATNKQMHYFVSIITGQPHETHLEYKQ
ncbi:GH25 family lysozyme [Bifidobacterium sp. SO4]|uniref:GH25 family lysozyme n=1 Tax=Bifidobacterium sp. SO4 TaxID=2809030 RepID=UPI001BDCA199|nr:GH25 family lysozyme [Bifidobacterium sp. SO4]MBT1171257.1 hypothetical protein [Bifidobacterium sp. SO4]